MDVTIKSYSYVMVDNKADTSVHRQIVNDVFGSCMSYKFPGILKAMAIEAQSAKPMNINDGYVQSFTDQNLHLDERSTPIETSRIRI